MIIAYLRVSTEKQNLSNQRSEIERFAVQKNITVDRFIMEIASGKKAGKELLPAINMDICSHPSIYPSL